MGLSSSKRNGATTSSPASSSSAFSQRTRSYSSSVLEYSCFRSYPQVSDGPTPGSTGHGQSANKGETVPNEENNESSGRDKVQQRGRNTCLSPAMEHESGQVRTGCMSFEELKPCTNFLSRFNCLSGNVNFMMRRRNSFGSSRPYISPATRSETLNNELEPSTSEVVSRGDVFSRGSASQSTRSLDEELAAYNLRKGKSKKGQRKVRVGAGVECDENLGSTSHVFTEGFESRIADRGVPGEIIESNARFSRTLSVGRLRDRGLHRMPFPDLTSSHQDRDATQNGERNDLDGGMEKMTSEENTFIARNSSSEAGPSRSLHGTQNSVADSSPPPREVQYHHPLEYRSRFLERRRRIRSQVRALQRIGSQFGNISGHEMTCILSGQHQRGHCACNVTVSDQNDKSRAGASVSRIVMLAEALFEVLDEIHQQSIALSSRPALSSIGSVPAPADVVELLPVRSCSEMQKNFQDDAAQCYICLIEYEQGDPLRILPCHHNFHKACIDKWLKEIHRVCPLCRGDVCKSDKVRVADM